MIYVYVYIISELNVVYVLMSASRCTGRDLAYHHGAVGGGVPKEGKGGVLEDYQPRGRVARAGHSGIYEGRGRLGLTGDLGEVRS